MTLAKCRRQAARKASPFKVHLAEVEIVAIECAQLHVLQSQRVRASRYDHVLTILTGVGENRRKVIKRATLEVDCVVSSTLGRKVRNGVVTEIRSKNKCICSAFASHHVIA